jgi:hypothetical protein
VNRVLAGAAGELEDPFARSEAGVETAPDGFAEVNS